MNTPTSQLFIEYLEGTLDEPGVVELERRLRADKDALRQAAALLIQEVHLREIGAAQRDLAMLKAPIKTKPRARSETAPFRVTGGPPPRLKAAVCFAGTICATLCLIVVYLSWTSSGGPRLTALEGSVAIERNGQRRAALRNDRLKTHDRLLLSSHSIAVLSYRGENTTVRLTDSADARIAPVGQGKGIFLSSGKLSAQVAPQLERSPMSVLTPTARATILGTDLVMAAEATGTRLEVWDGAVNLTRIDDGAHLIVRTGEFAIAGKGIPLAASAIAHGIVREVWDDPGETDAGPLAVASAFSQPPKTSEHLPNFEATPNWGEDFLARLRGYLRPPLNGPYRFWVVGDDRAELWLSTSDQMDGKVKICSTSEWTGPREWERSPSQASPTIWLEAGRTYYIEALQREGAGVDCVAVAWLVPGSEREVIPGKYLIPPATARP